MVAELVEDLVHLECGEDRLDQDGCANRPLVEPELVLGQDECVVPEPCLQMVLELGQVEVRPRAALEQLGRVVEEGEPEVEEARRDRLTVDEGVALVQVPAARARDEHCRLLVQPVGLPLGLELDRAAHRLGEVALSLDDVLPRGRERVLEVGHEHARARVHGVDRHLAVERARDLDTPVEEVRRCRRDAPVALAHTARRGQEVRERARVELGLALATALEQLQADRVQLAMEPGDERERGRREDVVVAGSEELDALGHRLDAVHGVNCASSVEPASASVELSPSAWSTASK